MAVQAKQSQYISKDKESVITNQEIVGKKWKFSGIFKIISYIMYGIFFGMLPATFKIANLAVVEVDPVVISSIVALLAMAIFSIAVIYWLFKGELKTYLSLKYSMAHVVNAALLMAGIIIATALYPLNTKTGFVDDLLSKQFILMIYYGGWAIISPLFVLVLIWSNRKAFTLSWSKMPYAFVSFATLAITQVMIWLAQYSYIYASGSQDRELFLIIALVAFIFSTIIFFGSIIYIQRFRSILLDERADKRVSQIEDWESARFLSIIASAMGAITFLVSFIWGQSILFSHYILIIDLIINALVVIAYAAIVGYIKSLNVNNRQKLYNVSRFFKSIDNSLLVDIFGWFILVKTALLQGIFVDSLSIDTTDFSLMAMIAFASYAALYIVDVIAMLNIPSIKNFANVIFTIASSIVLVAFTLIFTTKLQGGSSLMPKWLTLFMLLIQLFGISISLGIKICQIAKIFKPAQGSQFKTAIVNTNETKAKAKSDESSNEESELDEFVINDSMSKTVEYNVDIEDTKSIETDIEGGK